MKIFRQIIFFGIILCCLISNTYGTLIQFNKNGAWYSENQELNNYLTLISDYSNQDRTKKIEAAQNAIDICTGMKDDYSRAVLQDSIGAVYEFIHKFDLSYKYYISSIKIYKKYKDSVRLADKYIKIGNLFIIQPFKLNDAVKEYYDALKIFTSLDDKAKICKCYINLSAAYEKLKDYQRAIEYCNLGLELNKTLKNKDTEARLIGNMGNCYGEIGKYEEGIKNLEVTLKIGYDLDNVYLVIEALISIGNIEMKRKNYRKAKEYYLTALDKMNEHDFTEGSFEDNYLKLAEVCELMNEFKQSHYYLKKYLVSKEYNFNFKVIEEFEKIRIANQLEYQQSQIALLKQDKIIMAQKREREMLVRNTVIIISLILIIGLVILLLSYKKIRNLYKQLSLNNLEILRQKTEIDSQLKLISEQNNKLIELNATKDKFFSIIAHDLRNPLGMFREVTKMLFEMNNELSEQDKLEIIEGMKESSSNVYDLLENLLTWARTQTGSISFNPTYFDLRLITENNKNIMELAASKKEIEIINSIPLSTKVYGDANLISSIIRNLISNSIKFTNTGGKISIDYAFKNNYHIITVSDTGIGMNDATIDKLFRIDTHLTTFGTNNEKGTGLGLILCREFVEKHSGEISVESEPGIGSKFTVFLPLGNNIQ